jgi:uncharacterized ion transporter superfamily protein YfcC
MGGMPAVLVAGGMFVFAAGSSSIGMAEEYLPFVPMLLALAIGLGFDAVVGIGILCLGYAVGYGTALINPFTVMIAQDIAGLVPGSGKPYRMLLLVVFLAIAFDHVWRYARRVKADPARSLVADVEPDPSLTKKTHEKLNGTHITAIVAIIGTLMVMVYGLDAHGWYLIEMGGIFVGLTLILGLIGRLGVNRTAIEFCTGAAELTTTALLIGFARTIQVVLDDGQVVDTIVHGVAQPMQSLGPHAAAVGMLAFQSMLNFFIPSGSGQAYVTMPLMAPLADVVGVSRQTSVLAYQFGDGFTNMVVPTSALVMGTLALGKIPYTRWVRFVMPLMVKLFALAIVVLILAVKYGDSWGFTGG